MLGLIQYIAVAGCFALGVVSVFDARANTNNRVIFHVDAPIGEFGRIVFMLPNEIHDGQCVFGDYQTQDGERCRIYADIPRTRDVMDRLADIALELSEKEGEATLCYRVVGVNYVDTVPNWARPQQ